MAVKPGWTGRVFEDFETGDVYEHPLGRTVLAADNSWFTLLTMNTNPLHFDANYASKTEFGKPLVNSCLTLAIVTGQSVTDLSQNAAANLAAPSAAFCLRLRTGPTCFGSFRSTAPTLSQSILKTARRRRTELRRAANFPRSSRT
jgi:acyl dehydratase